MKKIIGVLMIAGVLLACNSATNKETTEATSPSAENHADHADNGSALALNNGAKWKADSITSRNVVDLRTIADNFKILPFPTIGEYQILSTNLGTSLNKLVNECKMTGPDHEALHQWLESVLKETNELKTVSDTAAARQTFKVIDQRIDNYHNYFE